jgi:hypothetical protein
MNVMKRKGDGTSTFSKDMKKNIPKYSYMQGE